MGSDNPSGAEDQQERLIDIGWVVGFVDGEGCFSIGFSRQPDRPGRRGYASGFQVSHRFVVTQGAASASCLEDLRDFFGVGLVQLNRRNDNHREALSQYRVTGRDQLIDTIIPFFLKHPLRTTKRHDFERFVECMRLVAAGRHLDVDGLIEIAEIAETMNRRKSRRDLIRILRGHTPNIQDTG